MRFAYREVAPPVQAFGNLVAQCFETQAVIALVNCTLTTLGLYFLKVSTIIRITTTTREDMKSSRQLYSYLHRFLHADIRSWIF